MARIRIRVQLNKGREGIPLRKLIAQSGRMDEFLRSIATDLHIGKDQNLWLAKEFADGSAMYTVELQAVEDAHRAAEFNTRIRALTSYQPEQQAAPIGISAATLAKYSDMREALDAGEAIGLGLYDSEQQTAPKWIEASRSQMQEVAQATETHVTYYGSVMGPVHELNKGSSPPFIKVRDLVTGDLLRCEYDNRDYPKVVELIKDREAIVNVYGVISVSRITRKIEAVRADRFELAPPFSDADYNAFFGSAPGITGNQGADEHVRGIRDDG